MSSGHDDNKINIKDPRLIIAAGILLLSTVNFYYMDANSNIRHGMLFWEALFGGRFFQYYSVCHEAARAGLCVHECTYDVVQALFMALWQFPLYVVEKILGGNILDYFAARVYGKFYVLVIAAVAARALGDLGRDLGIGDEKRREMLFAFTTGGMLITTVCVVGQIDILGTLFLIKSLHAVIKKDDRKFLLWFFLAVECKVFALFFILPVLLLTEKRIRFLALKLGLPLGLYLAGGLPFSLADKTGTLGKKDRLDGMVYCMLNVRVKLFAVEIPLLFLLLALVCLFAWLKGDNERRGERILWTALGGGASLLVSIDISAYDYWFVYLLPLILLLIYVNGAGFNRLLVLTGAGWAWIVGNILTLRMTFDATEGMLAEKIFGRKELLLNLDSFYYKFGHESFHAAWTVTWAVFAAALILLLIRSFPWNERQDIEGTNERFVPQLMYIRAVGNFILCNLAVVFMIIGR